MTVFPTFIPGCEPRRRWQDDGDKVLCQDVLEQLLEEKVGEAGTAGGKSAVHMHL